jgi:hypothetical protein
MALLIMHENGGLNPYAYLKDPLFSYSLFGCIQSGPGAKVHKSVG